MLNGFVQFWMHSLKLNHEVLVALRIKAQNTIDVDVFVNGFRIILDVIPDVLCRRNVVVHPQVEDVRTA